MYSVSEEYKKALLKKHITDTVEGSIILKDGTVTVLDDSTIVTGSLRITHELCDDYRIGTFNLGSMHIGFFDDSALMRDFSGAKITITYKIETENGWESVPMGIYIADGQSIVRRRNTVTLTAYDYGILFDCTIGKSIRNMSGNAESIISAVCRRCGVEFGGIAEGLPNTAVTVSPSSERIQSCRDLVGWCAAMLCGYAVIDREGKLKIISARYSVEADDPAEIIIDKYVTSAERDSIYSTDTRGWIAQMSAYSGGNKKIYKSNMTHDDIQAARAVYYLENNPLTEDMDESLCDLINCEWLKFIDAFLQRGVTAQLYGDPALDVGDILRCSEGDIDQRRSIVGLVTKQEWRYGDFHTVICAGPQLSDGFDESAEEESEAETEAVGETDNIYPVKVISQSEKRSDSGKEYYAGQGLSLDDRTFRLNAATRAGIGGSYMTGTAIALDDEDAKLGVFKNSESFSALRTATQTQKGGFFLGDGLVPVLEEEKNADGEKDYALSETVQLRLGDGLCFMDNNETTTNKHTERENHYGGRRVSVERATKEKFGMIRPGDWLKIDDKGNTSVMLSSGNGIDISPTGIVAVRVDGETVKFNDDGELEAAGGVAIDNAVIIKESDSSYLLHEYTEVEYAAGNRIGYGGPKNQIVVQGYVFHNDGIISGGTYNYASAAEIPDLSYYTKFDFTAQALSQSDLFSSYEIEFVKQMAAYSVYRNKITYKNGSVAYSGEYNNYSGTPVGLAMFWKEIYPPGSVKNNQTFPYGYVTACWARKRQSLSGSSNKPYEFFKDTYYNFHIGFASEAEYNAAVGLTYEPNTLTTISETITEV